MRRLPWWALLGLASWGCADLPTIQANQCGNSVVEPGEDCDTFSPHGRVCRPKGVVGECHWDCRPGASRVQCPDDMGCAADGICRAPTGGYETRVRLSSSVASWLGTLDFDGDKRLDVVATESTDRLQQARFRTYYFDENAKLSDVRLFPREVARPTIAELTGDGLPDLAFCGNRVGMVPGRSDRDWLPATFSSYVVNNSGVRAATLSEQNVGDTVSLAIVTTLEESPGKHVAGIYIPTNDGGFDRRVVLDHQVQELAGDPVPGDLVEGDDSPCAELALAFRGESSLQIFDMCRPGDPASEPALVWRDKPIEQSVALPHGAVVDAGPLVADVDGDGHLDVLVGAGGVTYVARGDGKQLAATAEPIEITLREAITGRVSTEALPMPLAAGDITGDGIADFVLPDRVLGSRAAGPDTQYFVAAINGGSPWSMAQVADLNGNELGDVIAAAAGDASLSFLNGTGGPYPVPQHIATQGPIRQLAVGDFDGDLLGDVAFTEGGPPSENSDLLAVAYGARDAAPLEPVRVAKVGKVEQLGRNRDFALDDIFAASTVDGPGNTQRTTFTIFGGDPARLPLAPYTLVEFNDGKNLEDWNALAIAAGAISSPSAHDIVALGVSELHPGDWTQWLIPDVAHATQTPHPLQVLARPGVTTPDVVPWTTIDHVPQLSTAGVAADLFGDGRDEVIWAMPTQSGSCAVLIYQLGQDQISITLQSALELDEACPEPELQALPLRRSDQIDLVLRVGPAAGPRQLRLLYNRGDGYFELDHGQLLSAPDGQDLRAASSLGPARGLVFVTEAGLYRAVAADPTTVENDENPQFDQVSRIIKLDDGRAVVVTDPDGGGVSDIVESDADGTWLLQAELR